MALDSQAIWTAGVASSAVVPRSGRYIVTASGTFASSVFMPQVSFDGTNWFDLLATGLSSAGMLTFDVPGGALVRGSATGGNSGAGITSLLYYVPLS